MLSDWKIVIVFCPNSAVERDVDVDFRERGTDRFGALGPHRKSSSDSLFGWRTPKGFVTVQKALRDAGRRV